MKKLLLIALLMLTIVFAAVACKDNTSKPADTTVEDGTTAEPTTTVAPETTAEPETTITETTAPETTVEETTAEETTVEETTVEETTAEETTVEETTAEETTVEETTAEETEPETVVVPENATNVALGAGVNASDAFIAGPWHSDALTDGIWTGVEDDGPLGWLNGIDKTPAAEEVTIVLTLQDVYVLYEASLYPAKGSGATTPGMDFPKAYELMVSEDGENWITVAMDANVDATAASDAELQPKVYNFGKAVKAKYFAIKITEHSSQTHDSGPNGILPKTILGEIELMGLDAALFDVFESDPMAVKPADAIYHVYDILTTGDSIADYFAHDYIVANGFGIGLGVGAYYHQDAPFGSPVWYVIQNSAAALSKKMSRAYVYTVDIMIQDGGGALNNSGFFVRGSEALYTGSWAGQTGDNEGFGGSGIYFNVKQDANFAPTHLVITLKSDVQGEGNAMTFTETNIEIPVTSDRISVADDGDTLYVIVDGTLLCTIDIVGTVAYADRGIEEGVIASKAVVTFVNGTTQTIENVACAADFGTLGIGARTVDSKQFTWTYVSVDLLENYDIPKFDKVTTDKKTYNAGEAINVTAMGFGTDVVKLFLKADFEAGKFNDYIYRYSVGFDSGKTVNILDASANPAMVDYYTVPAGEYVVALINAADTVIDSKVITVVGSIDVENPGEDAEDSVVEVPDRAKDAADVNQNDKLTGDIATGLNLGGVWTIYEFVLTVDGEYKLQVSVDGSAWTTVTLTEGGKLTATVLAQYIRFEGNVTAVKVMATFLGEPETDPVPDENAPEIPDDFVEVPENATNVALGGKVTATTSWMVAGNTHLWMSHYLVDGDWDTLVEGGNQKLGWRSHPTTLLPDEFFIVIELDRVSTLYQAILYPEQYNNGKSFPKAYELLVSEDGVRWIKVAEDSDVDAYATENHLVEPIEYGFEKAMKAKYFAIKITEHSGEMWGDYEYSAIGEIKVMGVADTDTDVFVAHPEYTTPVDHGYNVYDILAYGDSMTRYFTVDVLRHNPGWNMGIASYIHLGAPFGSYYWYVINNGEAALSREMKTAYTYTVDMQFQEGPGGLENSGIFVRGSEALYTGNWAGQTGDNQGFGGSGIYFNFKYTDSKAPTHLVITLKSDVQGEGNGMTFTETNIEIPVTDDKITISDDGNTVSVVVGGKLVATIAISGTKAYADRSIAEGVIASTAVVTLADGTTHTIENVACAADFGTLGIGARTTEGGQFTWTGLSVETPAAPASNEPTNVAVGSKVTATTTHTGNTNFWNSQYMVDGDWDTLVTGGNQRLGWRSDLAANPPAGDFYVIIELDKVYALSQAILYPEQFNDNGAFLPGQNFPKAYELMVSEDGVRWTTVASDSDVDASATDYSSLKPLVYSFEKAMNAKYFAIKITEHSGQKWGTFEYSAIGEVALMGVAAN